MSIELAEHLVSLKLDQNFIKDLNQDDIEFAEKEYQRMYAEQMSKISTKILKIERVKKHLTEIESEEFLKQKEIKESLNKKYQYNQKNKEKYITQKIKSYKLYQENWENKLQTIKKKNKDDLKIHENKAKQIKEETQQFWKTKTQQLSSIQGSVKKQYNIRYPSFNRNNKKIQQLKRKSKQISSIPQLKRQNTQNTHKKEENYSKKKDHHQMKTIRFLTQDNHQHDSYFVNGRKKTNQSAFSNQYSKSSVKQDKNISKHSFRTSPIDQNKFSQILYKNIHDHSSKAKIYNQFPNLQLSSNVKRNQEEQKRNYSFQKTMKKLDKIHKLKEKNVMRFKQKQFIPTPSKPRKPIDDKQYRLLRAKSQAKKRNNKVSTSQNPQITQYEKNQNNTIAPSNLFNNRDKQKKQAQKNILQSRISISQTIKKHKQALSKQIEDLQQIQINKWKRDKILKAIRDKIFKIKLEEMQKIKSQQLS